MASLDQVLIEIDRACASGSLVLDPDILAKYSIDESEADPELPIAVVRVRSTDEISRVLACASRHTIPVTARGGGTGRVGGAIPCRGGIVIVMEEMSAIKGIETADSYAVVQPGVVTQGFHQFVESNGLLYPPDPNSAASCTIGGNIGTNAGGPRTYKYGVTRDYILGMEAVLADGTILKLGRRTRKGVTGYDLCSLLAGSEGTLALVTEATLRLVSKPEQIVTLMVMLSSMYDVSSVLQGLADQHIELRCAELLDEIALEVLREESGLEVPENTRALLIVELEGTRIFASEQAERAGNLSMELGAREVFVAVEPSERERLWAARKELSRTLRLKAKFKTSEDVVVPRSKLPRLLDACSRIAEAHQLIMPTYGHAGDGNMHVNLLWDDESEKPRVNLAVEELFHETLKLGGTLSGEHGIGLLKKPYLPLEQSASLIDLQRKIKHTLDPKGILNPGKIFSAHHGAC